MSLKCVPGILCLQIRKKIRPIRTPSKLVLYICAIFFCFEPMFAHFEKICWYFFSIFFLMFNAFFYAHFKQKNSATFQTLCACTLLYKYYSCSLLVCWNVIMLVCLFCIALVNYVLVRLCISVSLLVCQIISKIICQIVC